jgi:hypothetical protein
LNDSLVVLLVGAAFLPASAFAQGPGERVACHSDDSKIHVSFYEPERSETGAELVLRMAQNEKDTSFPRFSELEVSAEEDAGLEDSVADDRIKVMLVHRAMAGASAIDDVGRLEGTKGLDGKWRVSFTALGKKFSKGPLDQEVPLACDSRL